MAKYIRSVLLPDFSSVLAALMARIVIFEDAVCIKGADGKTIGWIDIKTEDEALRKEQIRRTGVILNDIINDPTHAIQPDWSYLDVVAASAPAEAVAMSTRTMKKLEAGGDAKTA